ncbi:MAG: hypothetical protein HWE13_11920 [Gammaproteobacteria bacterium]|nr:hypothetical protein [Gammaproteobacteria bacterium]
MLSSPVKKLLSLLFSGTLLIGCIPTFVEIFLTPAISGKVYDVNSLKPIANVTIAFERYPEHKATSDKRGLFVLPAKRETQATIMMPAHALAQHRVNFSKPNQQWFRFATSSLKMYREESFAFHSVFVDTLPQVAAAAHPLIELNDNQLKQQSYQDDAFGQCELSTIDAALGSTRSARKLALQMFNQPQAIPSDQSLASTLKGAYQQSIWIWQKLNQTCERTAANYRARGAIIEQIEQEQNRMLEALSD